MHVAAQSRTGKWTQKWTQKRECRRPFISHQIRIVIIGQRERASAAVVLIIPLGGWLLRKLKLMFKVVSDSGFGIYVPHNPYSHMKKIVTSVTLG
jgi:hypothetical protein